MKIFCINLDRATERRLKIQNLWIDNLGLDIDFWKAYDVRWINDGITKYYCDQNKSIKIFKRLLSNGEIACATSFYQLFEFILTENINECIIMEDDIIPLVQDKNTIFSNIKKAKQEFPQIEVLLMHKISPIQATNNNPNRGVTFNDIFNIKKEYSSLCKKIPWGNQCFYITRKAIELVCQNLCKTTGSINIWYPADYYAMCLCSLGLVGILNNAVCDHHWTGPEATTYIGNDYRGTSRQFIP